MAESKANNQNTLTIAFAVFAVVCIGAFLWFRGSDVGQLPKLVGNLGGGPLFGSNVITTFVGIIVASLIALAWLGLGWFIVGRLRFKDVPQSVTRWVVAMGTGATVWSLIWFLFGLVAIPPTSEGRGQGSGTGFLSFLRFGSRVIGLYAGPVAIVACVIGVILAIVYARRLRGENRTDRDSNVIGTAASALIAIMIFLALVASTAPPIAKDTLLYHFSLPRVFIAQGGNAFVDGSIASYLALGTEMQYVWAMLLGGLYSPRAAEAATGATGFLFFPLLLMVVYGWAREISLSRNWALLATAVVATVPTAYHVASSGYIDLSLALYVTLATYALTRWWKEQTWGWVVLIAIFLGAALSVKLTAVFAIAAFALVMLLRARGVKDPVTTVPGSDKTAAASAGKIITTGFAALLLGGAIASPWYIRTWVATGSPVFPFYMSIWPGHANGWDVERSNLFQGMNSQYGDVDRNKLNLVTAPVRASIMAQPEQPANYDGVLGVAFLIGLPVLVWGLWRFDLAVEVKIAVGVAGVLYLFWLFSSEQLRYLLPILPLLAVGIAASGEAIGKTRESFGKVLRCALIAACVCGLLTSLAWICQKAPLRVVLGGETRDEYLTRNLDYYPYYREINTNTDPSSRVWLINMRRDTYNIERPVVSDYLFEDWTLRQMVWDARSVEELRAKAGTMNVQYVLARHDFLFDYDKSTLVDDKRPRAENEAKIRIAKAFLLDPARTVKADEKFSLVKVF